MSAPKLALVPGNFYHIYNRGINGCAIFHQATNYEHFLRLYDKYISPVADTYAWALMGNHFHLLVRILQPSNHDLQGFENLEGHGQASTTQPEKLVNQHFSNLFNAYTKAFNKKYSRTGSLFEHSFRRKQIDHVSYLKQAILYIHNNPVHHGFCDHPLDYLWTSYLSFVTIMSSKLKHDTVIGWFNNEAGFISIHNEKVDLAEIEKWLV